MRLYDHNGRIARDFFDCDVMISSLSKVMGLQSRQISKDMVLSTEKTFNMAAAMLLASHSTYYVGNWKSIAHISSIKDVFYGLPIKVITFTA